MAPGRTGPPSSRLLTLLAGDLPGHRRKSGDDGRVRFVPVDGGLTLVLSSRIEKRFLGRTEVAVFEADLGLSMPEKSAIELRHTGRLRRTGLEAVVIEGGLPARRVAGAMATDPELSQALLPLDFTRFELHGDPAGCIARVELMGASHVAIALPPIRSYVHLHRDQREAMLSGLEELRRVVASA